MKTSYKWLTKYINIETEIDELVEKLTLLGLECSYKAKEKNFSNIIIGKIIDCIQHPNSDHLSICEVDVGNKSKIQIICGAPNVTKNIFVPVACVGSSLNNGKFKIDKVKLRGVESNGMICSEKELQISEEHEGIMVLPKNLVLGEDFSSSYGFKFLSIELDITPNRSDAFSHLPDGTFLRIWPIKVAE